jgi:hypothetical protein
MPTVCLLPDQQAEVLTRPFSVKSLPNEFLSPPPSMLLCPTPCHIKLGLQGCGTLSPFGISSCKNLNPSMMPQHRAKIPRIRIIVATVSNKIWKNGRNWSNIILINNLQGDFARQLLWQRQLWLWCMRTWLSSWMSDPLHAWIIWYMFINVIFDRFNLCIAWYTLAIVLFNLLSCGTYWLWSYLTCYRVVHIGYGPV